MSVITSAEFQRNLGLYQEKALAEPITITKNGQQRLVLVSVEEYQRLKRRDQRARLAEEIAQADLDAVAAAKVSDRHAHLDAELKNWSP